MAQKNKNNTTYKTPKFIFQSNCEQVVHIVNPKTWNLNISTSISWSDLRT